LSIVELPVVNQNQGGVKMSLIDPSEKIEILATQALHYDRYCGCQYLLQRVHVDGKCGLACCEHVDGCGTHSRILLDPVYDDIEVWKISGPKALYEKYVVFANGARVGQFTLVLNSWVPN
jgi:hypothetical protein